MNYLKGVLDKIGTAVAVVDARLKIRFVNEPFLNLFGTHKSGKSLIDYIYCPAEVRECGRAECCKTCGLYALFREAFISEEDVCRKLTLYTKGGIRVSCLFKICKVGDLFAVFVDNAFDVELSKELNSAQNIQRMLLPPADSHSRTPYSYLFIPFRKIGGDLPDVYEAGGETMSYLADVSGKGISAGMISSFVKAGWDRSETSPSVALKGLSNKFQDLSADETAYVTMVAVRIEREEHKIRYSCAGHNAPLLLKSGLIIDEIEMAAPPISNWIPDFQYVDNTLNYREGDILVMLTDGVPESRNEQGEMFTIERVEAILRGAQSAEEFITRLKSALTDFCGTFNDDITAIAFDLISK